MQPSRGHEKRTILKHSENLSVEKKVKILPFQGRVNVVKKDKTKSAKYLEDKRRRTTSIQCVTAKCKDKTLTAEVGELGSISPTFQEQLPVSADPKSAKKTVKSSSFFVLLGSARVKAAHKHIDEIDPCWGRKFKALT